MQAPSPASTPRTALAPQPQPQLQSQRPHHHHRMHYHHHQQQQQQGVRLYDAPPPRPRTATTGSASSHRSGAPLPYAPTAAAAAAALTSSLDTGDVYFTRAQVVDSRISYTEDNRRFVEYKLEIETTSRGTLYAWYRYSVFLQLAATLQLRDSESGHDYRHEIPRLPSKKIFGNFSDTTISARVEKLNWFLAAATGAEFLDWGIRVDDGTCVYKRSAGRSSGGDSGGDMRDSMTSNASTATAGSLASPRRRLSRRLSLKSFGFRRNSNAV